jgi:hypothetical protein
MANESTTRKPARPGNAAGAGKATGVSKPAPPARAQPSWWQTLPGLLTAIAAVVTAVSGLMVGLREGGWLSPSTGRPAATAVAPSTAPKAGAATAPPPAASAPAAKAMGTLVTDARTVEFSRISAMAMGNGRLSARVGGARAEITLSRVRGLSFDDQGQVRIEYRDGRVDTAEFDCDFNLPVRFHVGEEVLYFGGCSDFKDVRQIAFH